ncbi:hypothetical protein AB0942_21125 [Streptomyces nodosus]|uniref:hypothetical protein n=1 Tax=Streptomyces nodosus TaxID=40318 RepID=UPI003454C6A3
MNPQTVPAGSTVTLQGGDCTTLGSFVAVSGGENQVAGSGEVQTLTSTPGDAWTISVHNPGADAATVNVTSVCQPV